MGEIEDFASEMPEFADSEKVTVLNTNAYPVQITSYGHILGGYQTAIVPRFDVTVGKAIQSNLVSTVQPAASPSKPRKR